MSSGATGYRIFQNVEYPNHVTVMLDFDSVESAEAFQDSEAYSTFSHNAVNIAPHISLLLEPFQE